MAKQRVPLHQNPRNFVTVEDGATKGAQLGRDLYDENGKLLTRGDLAGGGSTGGTNTIASTVWRLIREVPANIQKLAALATSGFAVRRSDGEWVTRSLQQGAGITITNQAGETGDPAISLADVTNSGAGALLAITVDGKGRVTGTKPATITGTAQQIAVANGNAAAGLPTISLADLPNSGVGAALVRITRDAKGRVSGTQSATTDDLPAGGTNKYFPEAPIDGQTYGRKDGAWSLVAGGGFGPPPTDGSPYVGLNGAWEKANAADSRFWLIEYPLLTDQAGNHLTDQSGNFLMGNSPIVPPGWPSTTTVINNVSSGALQAMTLAEANALAGVTLGYMVIITDLSTGNPEPCWYDVTITSGTKWRRFSDRSIAT